VDYSGAFLGFPNETECLGVSALPHISAAELQWRWGFSCGLFSGPRVSRRPGIPRGSDKELFIKVETG